VSYQDYPPLEPLLIGYDPSRDLDGNHLARLVDRVVDEAVVVPPQRVKSGRPAYNPKLLIKVLVYSYATGLRSSRQIEKHCSESLPYLLLTRGGSPSYRTLCTARTEYADQVDLCWVSLFALAKKVGIARVGRIDVDSTKFKADAGSESVIEAADFEAFHQVLSAIVAEADQQDKTEDCEGYAGHTVLGKPVGTDQMREIIRNVRKSRKNNAYGEPSPALSDLDLGPRMIGRVEAAIDAIEAATQSGQKHVSLTDPDAQMMGEGRNKKIQECHSFEVAADNGLLVAAQTSQSASDNDRLIGLVEKAKEQEPEGISEVVADSGYFRGDDICVLESEGIRTCVPDTFTASDIRKGLATGSTRSQHGSKVEMTYEEVGDYYQCPEGNTLAFVQERQSCGQWVREYRAQNSCSDCPLKTSCLTQKKASRRMLKVAVHRKEIRTILDRFNDKDQQKRYHDRGKNVETVFAFCRTILNFNRWMLRGAEKVAAEATLLTVAYQIRKIHAALMANV
jgi:transposase